MCAYGRGCVKALRHRPDALQHLTRLYWYTVEFGLIQQNDGSAHLRQRHRLLERARASIALEADAPNRNGFDLERIMRTRYDIDTFQKNTSSSTASATDGKPTEPDFTRSMPACSRRFDFGR